MRIGNLVTEAETEYNWQMYPGESGVIVACADVEMGFSPGEAGFGRFWMVHIGGEAMVFQDTDLVVVS